LSSQRGEHRGRDQQRPPRRRVDDAAEQLEREVRGAREQDRRGGDQDRAAPQCGTSLPDLGGEQGVQPGFGFLRSRHHAILACRACRPRAPCGASAARAPDQPRGRLTTMAAIPTGNPELRMAIVVCNLRRARIGSP
jgi:hypothetical protein